MSTTPAGGTAAAPVDLPRRIGTVGLSATLIGTVIGSGIFRAPSSVAQQVPTLGPFVAVWVLGGVLAVAGAMVFGELAATFPVTGGRYIYLREAFGPTFAFCFGWLETVLLYPVANGALAVIFATYLAAIVPALLPHQNAVAATVVLGLAAVNYRSTRASVDQMIGTTAVKVLILVVMAALLLAMPGAGPGVAATAQPTSWHSFGLALVTVMWAYSGWSSMTYLTGEVRAAQRTVPLVLTSGLAGATVLFVLVNLGYVHALSLPRMAQSPAVAADAVGLALGGTGRLLIAAAVVVSTFGALNSSILTAPRLTFAMAHDVPRLHWLAGVHSRYQTPHVAVGVTAALSAAYLWNHSFEQLATTFILGTWPFDILVTIGLFMFRRRSDLPHPFRGIWYPLFPVLFVCGATAMVINGIWGHLLPVLAGTALFALGVPIYRALRSRDGAGSPAA